MIWLVLGFDLGGLAMFAYFAWSLSEGWRNRRYWAKHPEKLQELSDLYRRIYTGR